VHDVPSIIGDRPAVAVGAPGASVGRGFEVFGFGHSVGGSVRGCAFPNVVGLASIRSLLAATSVVVIREPQAQSGVRVFGERVSSGVGGSPQGGHRASALRRSCDGEGGLRVIGVAVASREE
jgi:hypothetical protein